MKLKEHQYAVVLHHMGDELVYTRDPEQADRLRRADRGFVTDEEEVAHRAVCTRPHDIEEANGTVISSTPRPGCCQKVEAPPPTRHDYAETWTCHVCRKSWYVAHSFATTLSARVPVWREVKSLSFLIMLKDVANRKRYKI